MSDPEIYQSEFERDVEKSLEEQTKQRKEVIPSNICKVKNFFELNNNSNKYKWEPIFAQSVLDDWYKWYLNNKEIMYTSYPRENLHITYKTLVKKLQEFCQDFEDIRDEMDLLLTERLFTSGASRVLDKDIIKLAAKHLGLKWNDAQTVKVEGSIENELEKAYLDRIRKLKEKDNEEKIK